MERELQVTDISLLLDRELHLSQLYWKESGCMSANIENQHSLVEVGMQWYRWALTGTGPWGIQ